MKGLGLQAPSYIKEFYLSQTTPFADEKPLKQIKDEEVEGENVNQSHSSIETKNQSKFNIDDRNQLQYDKSDNDQSKCNITDNNQSEFSIDNKNQSHEKTDGSQLERRNLKRECDDEADDDKDKIKNRMLKISSSSCETEVK